MHVGRVIDNLFNDPVNKVTVYNTFEYQRTMVLLGNVNKVISKERRSKFWVPLTHPEV